MTSRTAAIFNPDDKSLIIYADPRDLKLFSDDAGMVSIVVDNLIDGIEIIHERGEIWWPIPEK